MPDFSYSESGMIGSESHDFDSFDKYSSSLLNNLRSRSEPSIVALSPIWRIHARKKMRDNPIQK